jgi:Bacterial PH domain
MSHDDFEFEPMLGLPARLPPGEKLLWQGSPRWESLAVRAYHVRKVAIYFGALILWRVVVGVYAHHTMAAIAASCVFLLALGGVAICVLTLLAFLNAGSTVYSITTRRVLMRHGVAVQLTMNIPLKMVESADLRNFADGTGEIALRVARDQRIGYLISWPHLRSSHITHPEPCFKALYDAPNAASLLSAALVAQSNDTSSATAATVHTQSDDIGAARPNFPAHTAAA